MKLSPAQARLLAKLRAQESFVISDSNTTARALIRRKLATAKVVHPRCIRLTITPLGQIAWADE